MSGARAEPTPATTDGASGHAEIGVAHGRFQPLHVGHLEYLLASKEFCDLLVVGITNPDPRFTVEEPSNPARSRADANPCSFYERYLMVEGALAEAGIPPEALRIVPFPHGQPDLLRFYAPNEALYLLTIYDEWGQVKLDRFASIGLATQVLWRREEKVTSGTEIRRLIAAGDGSWERLVPPAVAEVIRERGIDRRLGAGCG
jgi:cytidyltransferase-like protein